jgi:hypothetical protein
MEATAAFESLAASLSGQPISHLWRGYGSAIFFEFGELSPRPRRDGLPANRQGQVSLGVEWSWRVEDDSGILCGSWSDEALWDQSLARLRDRRIESLTLFGKLPEVELAMEGPIRFLSFSTTDGQPQWHLLDRRRDPEHWYTVSEGRLRLGDGTEPRF